MAFPELNSRLGTYRAYHLAAIVFISSFLSGYDSGIAGGIVAYTSFINDFDTGGTSAVSSLTVGLEQLGSFVAAAAVYPLTGAYGRKYVIIASTVVFIVGVIIQVVPSHSLGCWYVGRIVTGLAMGAQSVVVPMYTAEMTPKEIRGRCGSFYQWLYAWGVFVAYWVDYGVSENPSIASTSAVWQIPVGLQIVSGFIMMAGAFSLPESTRWLVTKGRLEEAWKSLAWMRGSEGDKTQAEFDETKLGLMAEAAEKEGLSWREFFQPANRLRFFVGSTMFVFQNATGSSALAVFAPEYFKLIVGSSGNRNFLLTGLFGAVKVIASTIFIWLLAERLTRRSVMIGGAVWMAACMLITALIVDETPSSASGASVSPAGQATVAMIYLDIMIYNCSWGPMPWAYVPEIFPTRIRAQGMAYSMLWHWASTFCFSFASPYMIASLGANTFLIFMGFDVVAAVFCWFCVKETRGKDLEHAAGTEWEVAERAADASNASERGAVGEGEGKDEMHLVGVKDTFGPAVHRHRS